MTEQQASRSDPARYVMQAPPAAGYRRWMDRAWDILSGPRQSPPPSKRVAVGVALLLLAAMCTSAWWHLTGDLRIEFYLVACVVTTWYGGLWAGLIAVIVASVLGFDGPLDSVTDWQVSHGSAWVRFAELAIGAMAFALVWEALARRKREMEAAVEHLQVLIDLVPAPIAMAEDPRCDYIRINAAMASMFGVEPGIIASATGPLAEQPTNFHFCRDGTEIHGDELPLQVAARTRARTRREELSVVRDDGTSRLMVGHAVPLFDAGGELVGAVGAFADITESRAVEAELRAANAVKDEFLGLVSHELKTPITVIRGNAELLDRRRALVDEESEAIAIHDIRIESERLSRLVDDLLTLSRLGIMQLEREPLLPRRIVDRIVAEHRGTQADRQLRVAGDAHAVLGAESAVEQVLNNLLANAERYSPPGTPVDVRVIEQPGEVEVSVRDYGRGIAPVDAERVFAPFYRSASSNEVAGGIGIGLTVCRRLVDAMGGHIWTRQPAGRGAEVVFTLPLAPDDGA
jgi:signal transduction histidine kinase